MNVVKQRPETGEAQSGHFWYEQDISGGASKDADASTFEGPAAAAAIQRKCREKERGREPREPTAESVRQRTEENTLARPTRFVSSSSSLFHRAGPLVLVHTPSTGETWRGSKKPRYCTKLTSGLLLATCQSYTNPTMVYNLGLYPVITISIIQYTCHFFVIPDSAIPIGRIHICM